MELHDILFKQFPTQPDLGKFVDWIEKDYDALDARYGDLTDSKLLELTIKYNNLLKQPLELKRLVAEKDGEVLENPNELYLRKKYGNFWNDYLLEEEKAYQKAMESVWYDFKKCEVSGDKKHIMVSGVFGFFVLGEPISQMINQPVTIEFWKELVK